MGSRQAYSTSDLDLIEEIARSEARESFWAYRQYMNPRLKLGWWQKHLSHELQKFYSDMEAGLRPRLAIEAPPQHGKSETVNDFIGWLFGKKPLKTIYASFSDRLGVRANMRLQRALDTPRYKLLFQDTRINDGNVVSVSGQHLRNREIFEIVGHDAYFRNTTVRGSVTGEGLDFGVIDDPIKGREEASSQAIRDKTWDWLNDDFMTRFSEEAALLIILTRWHTDDPVGRLKASDPSLKVLKYQAIADEDDWSVKEGYRKAGDPLFPEHKSLEFLMERKKTMLQSSWESLYQQNPTIRGGGLFPVDKFSIIDFSPAPDDIRASVRYWDKAGTQGGGAYTSGVLMHKLKDGRFCISDVRRAQLGAFEREKLIKQTAQLDGRKVHVYVEQEPGSGGKESAERTIANLAGFVVRADRPTGSKELRAEPYAVQVQAGNVALVRAPWNIAFLDEHESFPNGKYKDQVDAAGAAFAMVVGKAKLSMLDVL